MAEHGGSHGDSHGGGGGSHKSSGGGGGGGVSIGLPGLLVAGILLLGNLIDWTRPSETYLSFSMNGKREDILELSRYDLSKIVVIHGGHQPEFASNCEFVIELADGNFYFSRKRGTPLGLPYNAPCPGNPDLWLYDHFRLAADIRPGDPVPAQPKVRIRITREY